MGYKEKSLPNLLWDVKREAALVAPAAERPMRVFAAGGVVRTGKTTGDKIAGATASV